MEKENDMKEILDKLSSYNIFNYLLPGILFVAIAKYLTDYNFIQENVLIGAFLYYFIGMVVSRVGSLLIEPLLKKTKFVKFADYSDFISASKKDEKIELLSEVNNTYRTITSMFVLLLLLKAYNFFDQRYHFYSGISLTVVSCLILLMFLFAYRKQTAYITKRISKANNP
jgi:F0F1-type ATP synthase assembly protein I